MSTRAVAAASRTLTGVAVTAVLVTLPGPPVHAVAGSCPSGSVCLYAEYNQQGVARLTTNRSVPELYPPPAPLSVGNATGGWVLLYEERRYTGRCVAVRADANLDGGIVRSVLINQPDPGGCEPPASPLTADR